MKKIERKMTENNLLSENLKKLLTIEGQKRVAQLLNQFLAAEDHYDVVVAVEGLTAILEEEHIWNEDINDFLSRISIIRRDLGLDS